MRYTLHVTVDRRLWLEMLDAFGYCLQGAAAAGWLEQRACRSATGQEKRKRRLLEMEISSTVVAVSIRYTSSEW